MKIASTSNTNFDTKHQNNNLQIRQTNLANKVSRDSVSFSGKIPLKGGIADLFEKLSSNFFVEFLVVDSISMIIPRILIGLDRDREKTGKVNYKAGAEEAGREMVSGPSMNLIPMGILWAVNKYDPASHMEKNSLKAINLNMVNTVKKIAETSQLSNHKQMNEALANELFESAFSGLDLSKRAELKAKFTELLVDSTTVKPRLMFDSKAYKQKRDAFIAHVSEINNQDRSKPTTDSQALCFKTGDKVIESGVETAEDEMTKISAEHLFADFHNYSKDIIAKLTKKDFAKDLTAKSIEAAETFLEGICKSRAKIKLVTAVASFFTVGAFLLYLPKLCQRSKVSPAMESAKRAKAEALCQGGANENK